MKKILFLLLFIVEIAFGQIKYGYLTFYHDNENTFSCDTASLKKINNIITCRVIINPSLELNKKNYFVRQYLLNSFLNKYYVLGEIEYDSTFKVITTNNPKSVNPTEAKSINSDTVVNSLTNFLNMFYRESIFSIETQKKQTPSLQAMQKENSFQTEARNIDSSKSLTEISPAIESNVSEIASAEIPIAAFEEEFTEKSDEPKKYDYSNEFNVEGTIFSDGTFYCYQVSSWKNKSVAEKEVRKLINKGFNAFLMQAEIGITNTIWYRVRIGFFNSKEEALESQKKAKL